jgi:hypothetical protein
MKADARDIRDEPTEAGRDLVEIDDALQAGAEFSKKMAINLKDQLPNVVRAPGKSLKKIPGAYRVNFDRARDAYYSTRSPAVGGLKYAGWAAWANIQGAYYLVIEAPVITVGEVLWTAGHATLTALGVPGALLFHGLEIAWDPTSAALRTVWAGTRIALEATAGVIASVATLSYSVLSSGTAVALAGITAGGIARFKAGRYVFYRGPRSFFYPISLTRETGLAFDQAQKVGEELEKILPQAELPYVGRVVMDSQVDEYRSRFSLRNPTKKPVVIQVEVRQRKVQVTLEASCSYLKLVRDLPEFEGATKEEIITVLENQLSALLGALPVPSTGSLLTTR